MNGRICYDCMNPAKYLIEDKGTHVCQSCFGKRYYKPKRKCTDAKCTWLDLKRLWEK